MNAKQQISVAVATVVLVAALALVSWSYRSRNLVAGTGSGDVTVSVTSPDDMGPSSLREALFVAASAKGRATVLIVTRKLTLKTALPPLMNPHGMRLVAQPAGAEIDAQALAGGAVLDVIGPNTSIEGVILRNCPGAAVLLRAAHFHMHASVVESCDVGVEIAPNAGDVLLDDNRFANDRIGVRFAAPNPGAAVVGNTFAQARAAGLWAVRGDAGTQDNAIGVRDNRFTDDNSGVVAGNIPIVVEHNEFAGDAPDAAVHLIGAGAVIRNNHIAGPAVMGIAAENAREAVIEGNVLERLSSYAIMLRSSAGAIVRANRVSACASGMAFVLGDPGHPSTAIANTIADPKLDAIDVIGDSPILKDNQVLRPHALALRVTDYAPAGGPSVRAHPSLQGNNFRANTIGTAPAVEPTTAAVGRAMSDRTPTQIIPVFNWRDPRAHPLGDTWLLTIITILLGVGLPRVAGDLVGIDFAVCALGLLTLAVIHVGFAVVAARTAAGPELRTRLLTVLHLLGVVTVAFIWQRAGALQNPLLLAVFVLPVIGAVFISRWQSYVTAAVSVAAVAVMAAAQGPPAAQPHWYVPGLAAAAGWLSSIGRPAGEAGRPFAAFYAPAGYYAALLQVFAVVLFGCAVAAEYLRSVYDRLNAQVAMARSETLRSRGLWSALVEELPLPAALIDAETHEILCASTIAVSKWGTSAGAIAGRGLFEVLQFSYPEAIEALIGGRDGVEPLCMVHMGGQLLATEVRVQHIAEDGRRLALVTVSDTTEAYCVRAALDAAEHAALVVNASGRVLVLNNPARAVFPEAKAGSEVASLVPEAGAEAVWWDPGMSRCKKMHLTVARRVYRVTATAVALPGEEERLYIIALVQTSAVAGAVRGANGGATVLPATVTDLGTALTAVRWER